MVGSKTWTVLDSLELLDHDAVLMPLQPSAESPSGTAAAVQSSHPTQHSSETVSSSAPGVPHAVQCPHVSATAAHLCLYWTRISEMSDLPALTILIITVDLHWALGSDCCRV